MPFCDPADERAAARIRQRKTRGRPDPKAAPEIRLRSRDDVLQALETASALAAEEPHAARTIVMAARAAADLIDSFP